MRRGLALVAAALLVPASVRAASDDPRIEVELAIVERNGGACPMGTATAFLMTGVGMVGFGTMFQNTMDDLGRALAPLAQLASPTGAPPAQGPGASTPADPLAALLQGFTAQRPGGETPGAAPAAPTPSSPSIVTPAKSTGELMERLTRGMPDTSFVPLSTGYRAILRATLRPSGLVPGEFVVERGGLLYQTDSHTRVEKDGGLLADSFEGSGSYELRAGGREVVVALAPVPGHPDQQQWSLNVDVKHRTTISGKSVWQATHDGQVVFKIESNVAADGTERDDVYAAGQHDSTTGKNVLSQGFSYFVKDRPLVAQVGDFHELYLDPLSTQTAVRGSIRVMGDLQAVADVPPFELGQKTRLDASRSRGKVKTYKWTIKGTVRESGPCVEGAAPVEHEIESTIETDKPVFETTILAPVEVTLQVVDETGRTSTASPVHVAPTKRKSGFTISCKRESAPSYAFRAPGPVAGSDDGGWRCPFCWWGLNACVDNLKGDGFETKDHFIHHAHDGPSDWESRDGFDEGFTLATVTDDPGSPFQGWSYVKSQALRVHVVRLINSHFRRNGPTWNANEQSQRQKEKMTGGASRPSDFARAVALTEEHEQIHGDIALPICRADDAAALIEPMIGSDRDALATSVNTCIRKADQHMLDASSEAAVKKVLHQRHGNQPMVLLLPDQAALDGEPGGAFHPVVYPDFIDAADDSQDATRGP